MEIEQKINDLGKAFEQFKQANDARLKEIQEKGHADPILEEKVTKANAEVSRLDKELAEMKTAFNRKPMFTAEEAKEAYRHGEYKGLMPSLFQEGKFNHQADQEYKEAFLGFMRRGHEGKSLSVGADPDGGYLVRPAVSDRVIQKVFETSPLRQIAAVQQISTDALDIMTDLNEASGGWVGETGSRTETNTPQIGKRQIPVHELYANPAATQKLLDDAAMDMEAWLAGKVADKFSRMENTAFVSGNGVGKPRGFTTYAAGTSDQQIEQVVSGSAGAVAADGLMNLFYSLKAPYRANATWGMERATLTKIRQLKGSDNNYLWQPGLSAGTPSTLLGRPVLEMDDMPSVAADALAIVVADFREAYQIVDRVGIRTLRDPYSNKPYVHFYTTKRVGGDVVNFEAIKLQKLSA